MRWTHIAAIHYTSYAHATIVGTGWPSVLWFGVGPSPSPFPSLLSRRLQRLERLGEQDNLLGHTCVMFTTKLSKWCQIMPSNPQLL